MKLKIVLSGAGLLYPLHAGALWYLADQGYQIEHITGVSGGAIIAAAVASGYSPGPQLNDMLLDMLPGPKKLVDWSWKPWCDWGLIKGDRIKHAMQQVFVATLGDAYIPCNIGTVNLDGAGNYGPNHMVYSTEGTPHVNMADAVRASISIPFVFRPARIKGERHIDGGVASNFPLDIYGLGEGVFGFQIRPLAAPQPPETLKDYAMSVVDIMMGAIAREHIEDAVHARMVGLKAGSGSLNFNMNREEAEALIESGYNQAKRAFEGS